MIFSYFMIMDWIIFLYFAGCTDEASTSACAISIQHHLLGTGEHYEAHNAWRQGDEKLDWYGAEPGQWWYNGLPPEGTPAVWTTNDPESVAFQQLNRYGDHMWMVDVDMDCEECEGGWFEVKALIPTSGWEQDIIQDEQCVGEVAGSTPYTSTNHMGRCGYVNVFVFNDGGCTINHL